MKAAVLEATHAPLAIRESYMVQPRVGQVHVRILASGICGAQLQEIRGEKAADMPMPRLIGHEGCGIVEEIGEGVSTVAVGDRVVLHWRKGSGMEAPYTASYQGSLTGGPIHTFCTEAIISENRCTAVPQDTPVDLCCLLGCALSTALGVLENDAKLRMGESVLVVGCGGVGLSLISAAKMLGAEVHAVDKQNEKWQWAVSAGACTFSTPDSWTATPPFDCIIDTTGDEKAISLTMTHLASGGRYIMVGQPAPYSRLTLLNPRQLFEGSGATIIASQGGQFNPAKDMPRYVRLWRAGLLQAVGITHRLPLERINEGLDLMREGKAGRVLIDMTL